MPDIADDRAAFREAMARAEAASGIERDAAGNEINGIEAIVRGETPVAIPELEGAVPVQASDQPLTTEPVAPEAPGTPVQQQEAPAPPAEPLTVEQLQQQLAAAQARLEEKDSFIGRQSGEVGELRQAVTEMQERLSTVQAQQVPQAPAQTIQITQELIDNDPATAVQAAFAQQDEQALQYAFAAWREVDGDLANAWLTDRKLEQQQKAFDAKLAEVQAKVDATTAPLAQSAAEAANQQQWTAAFDEVKATRPDFLENAERLLTEVAPQYPDIANVLAAGDAKAKAQALSALYALDKMGNPQAVQAQLQEAANEAVTEAAAARAAAGVVTGQTTAGQPSDTKTPEELEQKAYITRMQNKASLSRGWTGRS
jgi:chromosome segregation ATPase